MIETVLWALVLALVLRALVIQAFWIPSGSMIPALLPRDRVLVAKFWYSFADPKRGQIIVFKYPVDPKRDFVKRLVGLPGETVEIIDGVVMIDGVEPAALSRILNTELEYVAERHRMGAEIFMTMGNFAPAMGMMGTLIGLVKMLMQMDDPSSIGPAMAVALLTTFYGVILANLIFLPVAGKLKTRSAAELTVKQLVIHGIVSVQSGDNPRILEEKLHSFVSPDERKSTF